MHNYIKYDNKYNYLIYIKPVLSITINHASNIANDIYLYYMWQLVLCYKL